MFDISKVQTALKGWIGVRQSSDTTIPSLDSEITSSSSGQYFDDLHPLLHTDTIYFTAPNHDGGDYNPWSALTTYGVGARVIYNDIAWQSKVADNLNNTPSAGAYWESMFSLWMREKINASIAKVMNSVITAKKIAGSSKALLENVQLIIGSGSLNNTIVKAGRFVGLAIRGKDINNIKLSINQVGIQFTQAQSLTIYLFHSSRSEAVATQTITTPTGNKMFWSASIFDLPFVSFVDNIDAGGTWYVGYFEDDINGNAIERKFEWIGGPCVTCPGTEAQVRNYRMWNKYFDVCPFSFAAGNLDGTNLPDIDLIGYEKYTNYGLNLSISVKPDITEIITTNKHLLTYPLGLQFAVDMLSWMAFNPPNRTNAIQSNAEQGTILYELDGADNVKYKGLRKELADAIEGLGEDLGNISEVLPEHRSTRIKRGAI